MLQKQNEHGQQSHVMIIRYIFIISVVCGIVLHSLQSRKQDGLELELSTNSKHCDYCLHVYSCVSWCKRTMLRLHSCKALSYTSCYPLEPLLTSDSMVLSSLPKKACYSWLKYFALILILSNFQFPVSCFQFPVSIFQFPVSSRFL